MTTDLVVADADEDYQSAIHKMDQANIRHLPVVSEGQLLSMLSIRDLLRVNMADKDAESITFTPTSIKCRSTSPAPRTSSDRRPLTGCEPEDINCYKGGHQWLALC